MLTKNKIDSFQRRILSFYRANQRDLPWRRTTDPYRIAVAEFMLQQTQVERVVAKYEVWIRRWPNWRSLAEASNRDLLSAWSGLGYNRRATYLGKMAQEVIGRFGGRLPDDPQTLRTLPGVGPYTANAILIFAFNKPLVTIDTNIRRVLIHELNLPPDISRAELEKVAIQILPKQSSRDWHNALMDYSRLALPRRIPLIPALSSQTRFRGSSREIRGEIIRRLTAQQRLSLSRLAREMNRPLADIRRAAQSLAKDGLVNVTDQFVLLR